MVLEEYGVCAATWDVELFFLICNFWEKEYKRKKSVVKEERILNAVWYVAAALECSFT